MKFFTKLLKSKRSEEREEYKKLMEALDKTYDNLDTVVLQYQEKIRRERVAKKAGSHVLKRRVGDVA